VAGIVVTEVLRVGEAEPARARRPDPDCERADCRGKQHNRGVVGKFGGDALTVVFPARGTSSRAPRRAVACALAMQDAMVGNDAVATAVGTFRLEAKIGVASGAVLCTTGRRPRDAAGICRRRIGHRPLRRRRASRGAG
jgi:class 3 adenylate cyclase